MVLYNAGTKELTAKIVYYGPGLGGKTTNLKLLHDRLDPQTVGGLMNLATPNDRTIYFDLLPVELGEIKGYKIRFQLATVPGQAAFNETRRVVLRGTDGIVFVVDSQWAMLPRNQESWQNLKDNFKADGVPFETMPVVVQYNKRDLDDILSLEAMQEALGLSSYPYVEAVASAGRGVSETIRMISKLTFVDLLRRLQGRRPEDVGAFPAPEASPPLEPRQALGEAAGMVAAAASGDPRPADLPFEDARAVESAEPFPAAFEARLAKLEESTLAERERREAVEKTTATATESLSARAEKLYREVAEVTRQVESLEASVKELASSAARDTEDLRAALEGLRASLEEKTVDGRREAEDIRTQIAPLLEAHADPRASQESLHAESDRLRESLADSLAEIAERLRHAPRER